MTNSDRPSYMTARDFIAKAVEFEEQSAAFYQRLGAQCTGTARDVVTLLAEQERVHARTLREFPIAAPEATIQFPPDLSAAMPQAPHGDVPLSKLIEIGIEREQISQKMYEHAAAAVSGSFRELLEGLSHFEAEHVERLRSLRGM